MKLEISEVVSQIYVFPTIKFTYDKTLYGYRNIEIWWLKYGIEIKLDDEV